MSYLTNIEHSIDTFPDYFAIYFDAVYLKRDNVKGRTSKIPLWVGGGGGELIFWRYIKMAPKIFEVLKL